MKQFISFITLLFFQTFLVKGQDAILKELIENQLNAFPDCEIAIGIIDNQQELKFGYKKVDSGWVSVNNSNTLFEIASISKVFTAALLAREVEKGTISIDDPLQKHIGFKINNDTYENQTLRIKHLVTHTSGLKKNPLTNYKRYSNYLKGFQLDFVPGTNWEYNNLTIGLLAQITAEKNQTTWSNLLEESILLPLGMDNTYVNLQETPEANRVQCVNKNGDIKDCYFHKIGAFQWPSGGMISNVDDMLKWLKANINETTNGLKFLHEAHQTLGDSISIPWFEKYKATQGFIWWHYGTEKGQRIICHGGNSPAQTSFLAFDKASKKGIVVLVNIDGRSLLNEEQIMKSTVLAIKVLEQ